MDIRCKKCLLREMANEDMYHRIQRTIDAIPPKLRCSKGEYDARLELCKECEKLIGGMCRVWLLCRSKSCQKKRTLSGNTAPLGWAATLGLISANFCHNLLPCSRNGGNYNNERNSDAVW